MQVDSFRFLPRSFRHLFEGLGSPDASPVWQPLEPRLAEASISLLTSAGLYLRGQHESFDLERERREPFWGDASYRIIGKDYDPSAIAMAHLHVNDEAVLVDPNVAFPVSLLKAFVEEGRVGDAGPNHFSVMGYLGPAGPEAWRSGTVTGIISALREQKTDGLILAPA